MIRLIALFLTLLLLAFIVVNYPVETVQTWDAASLPPPAITTMESNTSLLRRLGR